MHTIKIFKWVALAAAIAAAGPAMAAVRGKVVSLQANQLTVQGASGVQVVNLDADWSVGAVKPASIDAIKPGDLMAVPEVDTGGGHWRALVLDILTPKPPPPIGRRPYDLAPGSMQAIGAVASVKRVADGVELTLDMNGESHVIFAPSNVPMVENAQGSRDLVLVGTQVYLPAQAKPDGTLGSRRVVVGIEGAVPPI